LIFITSLCLSYLWRFDVVTESGSVLRVMGIVLLAYSGLVIPMVTLHTPTAGSAGMGNPARPARIASAR
jgi:hypothetical protein